MLEVYQWCVVVGGILCFGLGFGMGANDVGNNFGTSIGSRSITLGNAILIAGIFEFVGSVGLGSTVTDAFRKGVYYIDAFGPTSDLLVTANLVALLTTTAWLFFASAVGLSVSTTHSIVGSSVGVGLAANNSAINWKYLAKVLVGWLVAPILSLILAMVSFTILKRALLNRRNKRKLVKYSFPGLVFILLLIACSFFVFNVPLRIQKPCSYPNEDGVMTEHNPCKVSGWLSARKGPAMGISIGFAAVLTAILSPLGYIIVNRRLRRFRETGQWDKHPQEINSPMYARTEASTGDLEDGVEEKLINVGVGGSLNRTRWERIQEKFPWRQDLHQQVYDRRPSALALAMNSEVFDEEVESYFRVLQVISSSLGCLVHGANDVANAVAPFANIYAIYREGGLGASANVPIWLLCIGGAAITCGLTFFGYRVIKAVGCELIHITPCRGYTVEFSMTLILAIGSSLGLPLSTTQTSIGGVVGVGLMDGGRWGKPDPNEEYGIRASQYTPHKQRPKTLADKDSGAPASTVSDYEVEKPRIVMGLFNLSAVNWRMAAKMMSGWVATLLVNGLAAAAIYSFVVYSPTQLRSRYTPCWETNSC